TEEAPVEAKEEAPPEEAPVDTKEEAPAEETKE
ncbi:30S ribosomal protein S16, partial [bacterium]|nr:30S ribosomal protein S16 [bacterium]